MFIEGFVSPAAMDRMMQGQDCWPGQFALIDPDPPKEFTDSADKSVRNDRKVRFVRRKLGANSACTHFAQGSEVAVLL
jgi:hypothetical protein